MDQAATDYKQRFGKCGGTLLVILDKLPEIICRMPRDFYFGNYFTGILLINHLTPLNSGGMGTIRKNRQCWAS